MADQLLFGEYTRKLDERYRLSFPSELIDGLFGESTEAVIVKERSGALSLWNAEGWTDRYAMDMSLLQKKLQAGKLAAKQYELQTLGRLISTRHREVSISGRSRVLVPEGFRDFLGVEPGEDVIVLGAGLCIEVWRPSAWHQHVQENIPDFQQLLDELTA